MARDDQTTAKASAKKNNFNQKRNEEKLIDVNMN